jgi:hypothetical protein
MEADRKKNQSYFIESHQLEARVLLSHGFGGPAVAAVSNLAANPIIQGSGQVVPVGSQTSGRGYPVIPANGPGLAGNLVATGQFLPASFPAREPALTVLPPAIPASVAGARSAPAPTLVALETTSPAFGATLATILAGASAPSGGSAGVEPAAPSIAVAGTTFISVSSAAPAGTVTAVSTTIPQVTPGRDRSDLAAPISIAPVAPIASEIAFATSNETTQGPRAVPEGPPHADLGRAEGGTAGFDRSTAILAPPAALVTELPSSAVGGALARCWETVGDSIDELLKTEAAEAAAIARRLAPFVIEIGLCIAIGMHLDTSGMHGRLQDRRREQAKVW